MNIVKEINGNLFAYHKGLRCDACDLGHSNDCIDGDECTSGGYLIAQDLSREDAIRLMLEGYKVTNKELLFNPKCYVVYEAGRDYTPFSFYDGYTKKSDPASGALKFRTGWRVFVKKPETKSIEMDGKKVEISQESFESLKAFFKSL